MITIIYGAFIVCFLHLLCSFFFLFLVAVFTVMAIIDDSKVTVTCSYHLSCLFPSLVSYSPFFIVVVSFYVISFTFQTI